MGTALRILVVEDEAAIRKGLLDVFVYHGYQVEGVADGREGLARALGGRFDLVLLDVMLPGLDGFEICRRIRARDREQPIIMLTAKSGDEAVIQGLALGADDYVAKPFSVAQLVLRVQAVLRRAGLGQEQDHVIELGPLSVDTRCLEGSGEHGRVAFTRREVDMLRYLRRHRDRPVDRDELLHKVWGYARDLGLETRTVDIHVAKLRRKIEPEPSRPRYLVTVRGAGYRLLVD